jgi:hypothetical protein
VALGLEDLVVLDGTELADGRIDRAHQGAAAMGRAPGLSGRVKNSLKLA